MKNNCAQVREILENNNWINSWSAKNTSKIQNIVHIKDKERWNAQESSDSHFKCITAIDNPFFTVQKHYLPQIQEKTEIKNDIYKRKVRWMKETQAGKEWYT